ncbi:hypothetical protein [Enterobacter asburiae]|uniref:hypothetical protein n=1 Tax=Enterobacter asburiae TaxID=61645 RepID=UPI002A7FB0CA|nr:hypothetical protein [Enterobacter asburiae]
MRMVVLAVVYGIDGIRTVIWCRTLCHGGEIKMTKERMKRAAKFYLKSSVLYVVNRALCIVCLATIPGTDSASADLLQMS